MPTQEEVQYQQQLLQIYRRNLAQLLLQQAQQGGEAYVSLSNVNSIQEAREGIRRIKKTLRGWHISVYEDIRDDQHDVITGAAGITDTSIMLSGETSGTNESNLPNFETVHIETDLTVPSPKRFYLGYLPTWSDLAADLDVRRSVIYDNNRVEYCSLIDIITQELPISNVFVIYGEAGSGKSTFLRRIMFDLKRQGFLVFRSLQNINIDFEKLIEHVRLLDNKRKYIFIDDAQNYATIISYLSIELGAIAPETLIICAARKNEWNEHNKSKSRPQLEEIFLPTLSSFEIEQLLFRLKANDLLGKLRGLSEEEQQQVFSQEENKQLLVTLLESTQGKRFQDIVIDEFNGIQNEDAKFVYLSICVSAKIHLSVPEEVMQLTTHCQNRIDFVINILPSLDLVISRIKTAYGYEWIPRHRVIGDELVSRLCNNASDRLSIWRELLSRLSSVSRPYQSVQYFAANLLRRLDQTKYLLDTEVEDFVELMLSAGSGMDWRTILTDGKIGRTHPNQFQFRIAAETIRKYRGDDEAIIVIREGLAIKVNWNNLRLYQAIIEFERDNKDIADLIVQRILALADYDEIERKTILPIDLAVNLAIFKKREDFNLALEYLLMADGHIHKGMTDISRYFIVLSEVYENLGMIDQARISLERGVNFVRAPKWMVGSLKKALVQHLIKHKNEEFFSWIKVNYIGRILPIDMTRDLAMHAMIEGDFLAARRVIETSENSKLAINKLQKKVSKLGSTRFLDFLSDLSQDALILGSESAEQSYKRGIETFIEVMKKADLLSSTLEPSEEINKLRVEVDSIANKLGETNPKAIHMIRRAIILLGLEYVQAIVDQAFQIEIQGGMMISDNSRRRTLGGVFFQLLQQNVSKRQWGLIQPQ